jgi:hypothetical protein
MPLREASLVEIRDSRWRSRPASGMNLSRPHWFHAGLAVGCGRLYCHAGMGGASSIAAPGQLRAISTLRSAGALVRIESNTRRQILTSSRPQNPLLQAQDLRTQAESRPHAPTPTPSSSRSRVAGTRASVPRAGLRRSAARRSCCALPGSGLEESCHGAPRRRLPL